MLFILPFHLFTPLLNHLAGALSGTRQYLWRHISRKIHQVLCQRCKIIFIRSSRPAQLINKASLFTKFGFKFTHNIVHSWTMMATKASCFIAPLTETTRSIAYSVTSGMSPSSILRVFNKILWPLKVNKMIVCFFKSCFYPPIPCLPELNPDCLKGLVSGLLLHFPTASSTFSPNGVPALQALAISKLERQNPFW